MFLRVNTECGNRTKLEEFQKKFLEQIVQFARYTQNEIIMKCQDEDYPIQTRFGIAPSVMVAHFIYKSEWGKHPLAQERYYYSDKDWEHANNLALFEVEPNEVKYWRRPVIKYKGINYKSFVSWGEFGINFSDRVTFTHNYTEVLAQTSVQKQVAAMGRKEPNQDQYILQISSLISRYDLMEFDEP